MKKIAFPALVFMAFCCTGFMMHFACRDAPKNELGWTSVAGYDSEGYVTHYTSPVGLMEVSHRHPLAALAMAPVTLVGLLVTFRAGPGVGHYAVIGCFALIGALTCWLLWTVLKKSGAERLSRISAMALWLSFAHVWILGGVAELFSISMAIMLGVLLMVLCDVRDVRAWIGASALAGGVTVTNFVKPVVAWLVAAGGLRFVCKLRIRTVMIAAAVALGGLVAAALAVMGKWVYVDGITVGAGASITVNEVAKFLPTDLSLARRLWLTWNACWCEPMLLRESVIDQGMSLPPYGTVLPHVLGASVLALCAWSVIRNFRLPVVRAALAMVVFDFLLHVVIGWGIVEGQIYCGHWFWIVPLLVALLPSRIAYGVAALAVGIAVNNLAVVLAS